MGFGIGFEMKFEMTLDHFLVVVVFCCFCCNNFSSAFTRAKRLSCVLVRTDKSTPAILSLPFTWRSRETDTEFGPLRQILASIFFPITRQAFSDKIFRPGFLGVRPAQYPPALKLPTTATAVS